MSDPWVFNTQVWLNNTYSGVSGWTPIPATGKTGWPTMYALIRALQHELGIVVLSDNFGPGTLAALDALGNIGPSTVNKNIVRILQGGMYCKGYNGGDGLLDGDYSTVTIDGVQELRVDMGLSAGSGTVSPKVFKALLTMDAYVLVDGGASGIRSIQRDLNGRYSHREDFFIIPADGLYSRDVQNGLMFALQYEIGMADGVANGNFGPGTQAGLQSQANFGLGDSDASTGKYFIHLFQAALTFNGYPTPYTGSFTSGTANITSGFQAFCMLSTTSRSDFQTWASLLVSTGDVDRPGTAADTIREITAARATTLVANGYQTIGRYLTNTPNVVDPLDKNIKPGELATIFGAGMTVFPIFQEGGDDVAYFNYSKGYEAGLRAHNAAYAYGFKAGTVIYFAVDFDAFEYEVYDNVLPHFQGIRDSFLSRSSGFRIGIYGSRNTCAIISRQGIAQFSFVSGMSTGFSGNLGYPLPQNWAFDQILEYEIGSGSGWVNIDKDIKSGRDLGQSSVNSAPPVPVYTDLQLTIQYIFRVQLLANEYYLTDQQQSVARYTAGYLRLIGYNGPSWNVLAGPVPAGLKSYVEANIPLAAVPSSFSAGRDPVSDIDWVHMMATCSAYLPAGPSTSLTGPQFSDIGGWAGDQATLACSFYVALQDNPHLDAYDYSLAALAGTVESSFGPYDLNGDIMAWVAAYSFTTR